MQRETAYDDVMELVHSYLFGNGMSKIEFTKKYEELLVRWQSIGCRICIDISKNKPLKPVEIDCPICKGKGEEVDYLDGPNFPSWSKCEKCEGEKKIIFNLSQTFYHMREQK